MVTEIYGFGDLGGEDRARNEFAVLIVELGRLMAYDFLDRGGGWLFTLDIVPVEILNGGVNLIFLFINLIQNKNKINKTTCHLANICFEIRF